jgi:protein gp37
VGGFSPVSGNDREFGCGRALALAKTLPYASVREFQMSSTSKIEWTDATWNPVRGCMKISPGCKHCYAERFAERFRGVAGHAYEQGFDVRLVPGKLMEPFRWPRSRMVFVNSMSDLFQDDVPDDYIFRVVTVMQRANWHTYQVLTKRSERMARLLRGSLAFAARLPHIWWGVSVEDRRYGIPRVLHLQDAPARCRFLSIEPLLEHLGHIPLRGIDWAIVGGESGPGARTMESEWVESILAQCRTARVPFFFKQWGGRQKSKTGRTLHDRTYDEMPRVIEQSAPSQEQRRDLATEFWSEYGLELECFSRLVQLPACANGS